ncbi:hypothetical protein DICA3_D05402 [Diutina catenulata]
MNSTEMTVQAIPAGVYTPTTTFFEDDEKRSLDLKTQACHAKWLYENGITGVVVPGSMGEAAHLTATERQQLVATMRQAVPDPAFKVIAGAPPLGAIEDAVEESKRAKEVGADYFIVLVPGFFGTTLTSQQGIAEYFTKVADESVLPVMIYNYPGVSNNVTVTIETFRELSKHPNICGVKLTHFNLDIYALLGKDSTLCETNNFRPFTGLGQILVPALSVGIYGTIDALSALFPRVMVRLYSLYRDGDYLGASELQFKVTGADQMLAALNIVGVKYALKQLHGWGNSVVARPPLGAVNVNVYNSFSEEIKELVQIEKSLGGK